MNHVYIYGLIDPTTNQIRYVGQSNDPWKRFARHISPSAESEGNYKSRWIAKLMKNGLMPRLTIVDRIPKELVNERERDFISLMKFLGFDLTNLTKGGQDTGSVLIPVKRIDLKTGQEKIYPSIKSTEVDGFIPTSVVSVCKGKNLTHGGYLWKYMSSGKNTKRSRIIHKRRVLRPVIGIDLKTGQEVQFSSAYEAQKLGYCDRRIIRNICDGYRKTNHGWTWKWA